MLRTRLIPVLLLQNRCFVKTKKFSQLSYIGDPCNTVRIFNELEVDEIVILDISAARENRGPDFEILSDIASECFMPLAYGGGIKNLDEAKKVFEIGYEKVIINSSAIDNPNLISNISNVFGSQSVIVSIDVKQNLFGKKIILSRSGTKRCSLSLIDWAKHVEKCGAGEILLTSIDREGTWQGMDIESISELSSELTIPVIAHGGVGSGKHIEEAVKIGKASAVAIGSMLVYQKKDMGVLINFPDQLRSIVS